jgi:hypothetical protein
MKSYLIRLFHGTECVAEAPFIIHDREKATHVLLETAPNAATGIAAGLTLLAAVFAALRAPGGEGGRLVHCSRYDNSCGQGRRHSVGCGVEVR